MSMKITDKFDVNHMTAINDCCYNSPENEHLTMSVPMQIAI